MKNNDELVDYLVRNGLLKSPLIIQAFREVDRKDFMWPGYKDYAYIDSPAPLGETGQTISAPHMNAYVTELLNLTPNDVVLEVGAGSGYQAAILGAVIKLGRGQGHIYSIEYIKGLYEFAHQNIMEIGLEDYVTIIYGDGSLGWPPLYKVPIYDKIVVSAAAKKIPKILTKQLKEGGRMLIPIGTSLFQTLFLYEKRHGKIIEKSLFPVAFVPLREKVFRKNEDNGII